MQEHEILLFLWMQISLYSSKADEFLLFVGTNFPPKSQGNWNRRIGKDTSLLKKHTSGELQKHEQGKELRQIGERCNTKKNKWVERRHGKGM